MVKNEFKDEDIMVWQDIRALNAFFNMLTSFVKDLKPFSIEKEFTVEDIHTTLSRITVYILPWAFGSSFDIKVRKKIGE